MAASSWLPSSTLGSALFRNPWESSQRACACVHVRVCVGDVACSNSYETAGGACSLSRACRVLSGRSRTAVGWQGWLHLLSAVSETLHDVEHLPPSGKGGDFISQAGVCPTSYQTLPQGLGSLARARWTLHCDLFSQDGAAPCQAHIGWLAVSPICHLRKMGATAPSHAHSAAYREVKEKWVIMCYSGCPGS